MPVTYAVGTADANGFHSGISVNTPAALLTAMKTAFEAAGQTVTDEIATNNKIIARGVDQGDFCYKIYTVSQIAGSEYKLSLRGDSSVGGAGTTLSPATIEVPFSLNGQALLYLTADEAAECLTIINPSGTSRGIHAGWLERRRLVDKGAWMVGYLDVWMTAAYFAKDVNNLAWKEAHTYYYTAAEAKGTTSTKGAYQHLWDTGTTALVGTTSTTTTSSIFNYKSWQGANDPVTGQPKLHPYGYLQGAATSATYTVNPSIGQGLHNPGYVKFARTGMAFMQPGAQTKDGTEIFVSAGGSGDEAYQGFKIAG
jgi:hypothetical protein